MGYCERKTKVFRKVVECYGEQKQKLDRKTYVWKFIINYITVYYRAVADKVYELEDSIFVWSSFGSWIGRILY